MKPKIIIGILVIALNMVTARADFNSLIRRSTQTKGVEPSTQKYIKSGTRYLFNIHRQWDQLDAVYKKELQTSVMQQPAREKFMLTSSGHFTLHWDESGYHAVPLDDVSGNGIPDYIDSAAVIFDYVWNIEIDQMGYQPPLGEDGNPVSSYHVYFSYLKDGIQEYYGLTHYSLVDIPSVPGENYTSYMEVHKDFEGFPSPGLSGLKVTAAHEFHHAIQFGYNVREQDFYFFEMTSTWMEDVLYPEINDYYQYLNYFFRSVSNTRFDLYNSSTLFPYGNAIYLQMLEHQFGADIVQKIWEQIKIKPSLEAIRDILSASPYYSSWLESLNEYGIWLYYTGDRAVSGQFFPEAADFPQIRVRSEDNIEFNQSYSGNITIDGLTNMYMIIQGINNLNLNIFIESSGSPSGGFRQISPTTFSPLYPLNEPVLLNAVSSDTSVILLCNAEDEEMDYAMDIKLSENVDRNLVYAYPNPLDTFSQGENIRFLNIPKDAELNIFNMAGKTVATIPGNGGSGARTWDLRNKSGEAVASGIYIFMVQGDNIEQSGKFSIVR